MNNSTVKCRHFFGSFAFFREIFKESCVEKYKKFNGVDFSSMRARTKVLAIFEAGLNSPNLPWHVNITSETQKPIREVPCFRQIIHHGLKVDLNVSFFSVDNPSFKILG